MEWLNYHHLRYFWVVAREGSLRKAAELLRVSQPSICAQVKFLEKSLGEPLFQKQGRSLALTETGHMVYGYAGEIFAIGQELTSAVKQAPTTRRLRLNVGISDSFPKLLSFQILKPLLTSTPPVYLTCREGKNEDLLDQLSKHRLDVLLSDEPAPTHLKFKTFNHSLGTCGVSFAAHPTLANSMNKPFPACLHRAPSLLPAQTSNIRRSLDQWFQSIRVQPTILAEFEDGALAKVVAADGLGFIAIPTVVEAEAIERYRFRIIGRTTQCQEQFFAITAERRMTHPALLTLTNNARTQLFSRPKNQKPQTSLKKNPFNYRS
ncbi:MAG: LysR family transcriptional regulator [Verrucomicrobiota bacterium]|nr:LysR family transcriptional regulator [Verrucomicrobiota bacterium]